MEIIGWIGAILFSVCGLPQAWQCAKDGHARGLNWAFLLLWLGGEIFTIIYIWDKPDLPLKVNYMVNLLYLIVMIRYKLKERA